MTRKTKFKVNFLDLVRPETYVYADAQKLLLTYQWMGQSMQENEIALAFLTGQCTLRGVRDIEPLGANWLDQIRTRFSWVVASKWGEYGDMKCWREKYGVSLSEQTSRIIYAPWHDSGDGVRYDILEMGGRSSMLFQCLTSFLSTEGRLTKQLNPVHPGANLIQFIDISFPLGRIAFNLHYGFTTEPCASSWSHRLAWQEDGQSFLETWVIAQRALLDMLEK